MSGASACVTFMFSIVAGPAVAHAGEPATLWMLDPLGGALLVLLAAAYALGQLRVARRGAARRERRARTIAFWLGWGSLALALGPPLEALTSLSFAAHMAQHEIMMLIAAPLLVLARPLGTLAWGVPRRILAVAQARPLKRGAAWLAQPVQAWLLHAVALWGWHVPWAFQAALRSDAVHWLQHASFFTSAVFFWWAALMGGRAERRGIALLSLFTTAAHTSILGALLTFSTAIWYPIYDRVGQARSLSTLEDQQLGGLIMWVPGGMVFVIAAVAIAALWLKELEARTTRG